MTQILGGIGVSDGGGGGDAGLEPPVAFSDLTPLTPTAVPFADASGYLTEDPTVFVYDATNNVLRVPTIVGGTSTTDDLRLRATTGNGGTGARVFIEGGNNGAVPLVEFRLDAALSNGMVGIGTAAVGRAVSSPLTIFGVGGDIGNMISATAHASNPSAFCQLQTAGGDVNAQAGFNFDQQANLVGWRSSVVGNSGNAFRWQAISSGASVYTNTCLLMMPVSMNLLLASANTKDVTTGTRSLVVEKGTAPTACAADTAAHGRIQGDHLAFGQPPGHDGGHARPRGR